MAQAGNGSRHAMAIKAKWFSFVVLQDSSAGVASPRMRRAEAQRLLFQ
jgi:hypothetical protein